MYAYDRDDQAEIIQREMTERQAVDRGEDSAGEELLRNWRGDLSKYRRESLPGEIEKIIAS